MPGRLESDFPALIASCFRSRSGALHRQVSRFRA